MWTVRLLSSKGDLSREPSWFLGGAYMLHIDWDVTCENFFPTGRCRWYSWHSCLCELLHAASSAEILLNFLSITILCICISVWKGWNRNWLTGDGSISPRRTWQSCVFVLEHFWVLPPKSYSCVLFTLGFLVIFLSLRNPSPAFIRRTALIRTSQLLLLKSESWNLSDASVQRPDKLLQKLGNGLQGENIVAFSQWMFLPCARRTRM